MSDESSKPESIVESESIVSKSDPPNPAVVVKSSRILASSEFRAFSGPLPPPETLQRYNDIHPGAADRIIRMAEEQGAHRRHLEKTAIGAHAFTQRVGPILGFTVAMTAIVGGIWLLSKGLRIEGLTSILGTVVSLAGVFIYGKSQQAKELQSKDDNHPPAKKSQKRRRKK